MFSFLKILNCKYLLTYMIKQDKLAFQTKSSKFYINKKIKNNFIYHNDHDLTENNCAQHHLDKEEKIISADMKTLEIGNINRNDNFHSLNYKGEILFGIHPVYLALLNKRRKFYKLFLRKEELKDLNPKKMEIKNIASSLGIPIYLTNTRGLNHLTSKALHQGVCLDASPLPFQVYNYGEIENLYNEKTLWLVMDEILDPMNVGAIIRSAYYFGIEKLFMVKGNICKLSPIVSKASSGAMEVMNLFQIENLEFFIQEKKKNGWIIISSVAYDECKAQDEKLNIININEFKLSKPTILILGNEGKGISSTTKALCDFLISIYPKQNLYQGIDSLNVSVAAGILLHAIVSSDKAKEIIPKI